MKPIKRILSLLLLVLLITGNMRAQVTIGDRTEPRPFSLLEITTNNQNGGLRLPQLDNSARDALNIPSLTGEAAEAAKGLVIYNTSINCIECWNGQKWISFCGDNRPVGQNIEVYPDLTQTPIPYTGGQFGSYTLETDPSICASVTSYTVTSNQTWCQVLVANANTGIFTLAFDQNTGSSSSRFVEITVTALPCNISAIYTVEQSPDFCSIGLRQDIPESITINGTTWATKNIDDPYTFTSHASQPGKLYQWGTIDFDPNGSSQQEETTWEITPCPAGWTLPTPEQMNDLINSGSVWVTSLEAASLGLGCEMGGRIFNTGNTTKEDILANFNPNTHLFFPAAGSQIVHDLLRSDFGIIGCYWHNMTTNSYRNLGGYLSFGISGVNMGETYKYLCHSIRCVRP